MPQVNTPHEFLARWNDAGVLQGAHIVYRQSFQNDAGVEEFSKFGDPLPVALSDAALLSTISADINTAALADGVDKAAQIAQLTDDKTAADTARDAALAQVAGLQAQIAELQPPTINGVPQEVTMRQAQEEMLYTPTLTPGVTLLDAVEATINAIADPIARRDAQITWNKSSMMLRTNALLIQLRPLVQQELGLADAAATDTRIDQLFVSAATR